MPKVLCFTAQFLLNELCVLVEHYFQRCIQCMYSQQDEVIRVHCMKVQTSIYSLRLSILHSKTYHLSPILGLFIITYNSTFLHYLLKKLASGSYSSYDTIRGSQTFSSGA